MKIVFYQVEYGVVSFAQFLLSPESDDFLAVLEVSCKILNSELPKILDSMFSIYTQVGVGSKNPNLPPPTHL